MRKQFNAEIQEKIATEVRVDAVKLRVRLGVWAEVAFERFLALPAEVRKKELAKRVVRGGRANSGRPIAVAAGLLLLAAICWHQHGHEVQQEFAFAAAPFWARHFSRRELLKSWSHYRPWEKAAVWVALASAVALALASLL